jgi:hypothetical protein
MKTLLRKLARLLDALGRASAPLVRQPALVPVPVPVRSRERRRPRA